MRDRKLLLGVYVADVVDVVDVVDGVDVAGGMCSHGHNSQTEG